MAARDEIPGLGLGSDKPRLNTALDFSRHKLSPTEGFVLSRVDGRASYEEICRLSGLGRDATLDMLRQLKQHRIILGPGEVAVPVAPRKAKMPHVTPPPVIIPVRVTEKAAPARVAPAAAKPAPERVLADEEPCPPARVAPAAAKPAPAPVAARPAPADRPAARPAPADRPAARPAPADKPAARPAPADKPAARPAPFARAQTDAAGKAAERSPRSLLERLDDGSPVGPGDIVEWPDASSEFKARVVRLHRRLRKLAAHELLGVPADADLGTVKRAFTDASKELHPDRYFGKNLGSFKPKLAAIFARLTEAVQELEKTRKGKR